MADNEKQALGVPTKVLQQRRKRQQRNRRGTLIRKAYEFSALVDTDVFVGIRDRKTGRIRTFLADPDGFWSSQLSRLVKAPCCVMFVSRILINAGFLFSHSRTKDAEGFCRPTET